MILSSDILDVAFISIWSLVFIQQITKARRELRELKEYRRALAEADHLEHSGDL
jgi:hypothetical protein